MLKAAHLEEVIEIASGVKDCLRRLFDAYGSLPAVIRQEHAAIEASDLKAIESARVLKEEIGAEVEIHFGEMKPLTARLARLHHQATGLEGEASPQALGMHAVVSRLKDLIALAGPDGLAVQVLSHLIPGLEKATADFEARMQEIQPLVDMNKFLLERLLTNYRESYRFWQTVVEETQTPYDARGVRRTKGRGSGFVAKA